MGTIVETKRLRLREMEPEDKDNLATIFSDPIAMQYFPSTKNEEETVRWITWNQNNYRKYHVGLWVVEDKETGNFLGQCGFVPQKIDGKVEMELGYLFVRESWGKGFATEATVGCLHYGIEQLKINRFVSVIDPENVGSIHVAKKAGMTFEKQVNKRGKTLLLYSMEIE